MTICYILCLFGTFLVLVSYTNIKSGNPVSEACFFINLVPRGEIPTTPRGEGPDPGFKKPEFALREALSPLYVKLSRG
jgi:hypothetical protein